MPRSAEQSREEEVKLLAAIKDALPRLEQMWQQANSHWGYEDPVYRFYHQSFKVYHLQARHRRNRQGPPRSGSALAASLVHADRR